MTLFTPSDTVTVKAVFSLVRNRIYSLSFTGSLVADVMMCIKTPSPEEQQVYHRSTHLRLIKDCVHQSHATTTMDLDTIKFCTFPLVVIFTVAFRVS